MNDTNKNDGSSSNDERLNEVLAEYLIAIEDGDKQKATELEQRFPEYKADLNSFVNNKRLIDRLAETRIKSGKANPLQPASEKNPRGIPAFEPPSIEELEAAIDVIKVDRLLGRGAMGAVYKAKQTKLDRWVAIKVLPKQAAEQTQFVERFNREARAMARLIHPNILTIFDFGQSNDICYLVMELVDGVNLREAMQASEVRPAKALEIVGQICDALSYAHQNGVVHRDIKPENILLDRFGNVKIADFGLAKVLDEDASELGLTATQQVLGTYRYMAPEQLAGSRDIDHRVDIYSLGVVFYELLTGQLPMGNFQLPSESSEVDQRIDPVVSRALEQSPDRRYQQASDVKTDISKLWNESPLPPVLSQKQSPTAKEQFQVASDVAADPSDHGESVAPSASQKFPMHNVLMIAFSTAICAMNCTPWKRLVIPEMGRFSHGDVAASASSGFDAIQMCGFEFLAPLIGLILCAVLIGWIILDFWKPNHWLQAAWAIAAGLTTAHAAALVGYSEATSRNPSGPFHTERYNSVPLTILISCGLTLVGLFALKQSTIWDDRNDLLSRKPSIRQQLSGGLRLTIVLSVLFSIIAVVRCWQQGDLNEQLRQMTDPFYQGDHVGYFDSLTATLHLAYSIFLVPIIWTASNALEKGGDRKLVTLGCIAAMVPLNYAAALGIPLACLILILFAHDKQAPLLSNSNLLSSVHGKRGIQRVAIANLVAAVGTIMFFSVIVSVEFMNILSSKLALVELGNQMFCTFTDPLLAQADSSGSDYSSNKMSRAYMTMFSVLPCVIAGCIHAFASIQMLRLRSYNWSIAALIIGLIPFTFSWFLSAPFSLWCLFFMRQEFSSDSKPDVIEARDLFSQSALGQLT